MTDTPLRREGPRIGDTAQPDETLSIVLGWDIAVIRPREPILGPEDPRLDPSTDEFGSLRSSLILQGDSDTLASWSAGLGGLRWLDEHSSGEQVLCRELRGGGYPSIYAAPADVVLTVDLGSVKARYPETVPSLDLSAVAAIPSGEWLLVEAWDQS